MSEKTILLLQTLLESDPDNWATRSHLAELLVAADRSSEAAMHLKAAPSPPTNEQDMLSVAALQAGIDPDAALDLLAAVIHANKACAAAYRIRADIFLARGQTAEARKNYNVAAVIDESFEDNAFEAKLDGKVDAPPPLPASPAEPRALAHGHTADIPESELLDEDDSDDFADGDALLDEIARDQHDFIDFSDIGGMEELKDRIRMSIIHPFKNKALFEKFKKRRGGGLLFYGPPGCGKTLIARATAGECGAHFMNIAITDVLSKWIGESEKHIHEIFVTARRKAPTIIFIDEIDALGVKRADAGNSASVVNTLLTEIDGAGSKNEDVLVLGATNTPWRVDSAFRRPGRFDHVLFVPPPDQAARASIFKLVLADVPQERLDFDKLAKLTPQFSGADIRALVESASEKVIESIMKTGKDAVVTQKGLLQAIKKARPTTLEWLDQANNYASYSNSSGLYDDLAAYLERM